jgi:hypothetical protein
LQHNQLLPECGIFVLKSAPGLDDCRQKVEGQEGQREPRKMNCSGRGATASGAVNLWAIRCGEMGIEPQPTVFVFDSRLPMEGSVQKEMTAGPW